MISVVIPLYNKEFRIKETIDCVLNQSFKDFELIIVNDGSTDSSADIVKSFSDSRIRLIEKQNGGVSLARNTGIEEARGKYIAFLDADDLWAPDFLKSINDLINAYPTCDVFASRYILREQSGKERQSILNDFDCPEGKSTIIDDYFRIASVSEPPLWSSSIAISRDALISIGGFPIGIKSGEDLLTWARLACRFKIAYINKPLAIFNIEGYNKSDRPKRLPAEEDIVARELISLAQEYNPPHINKYISHWYKMRASIYMRLNMRKKSISESIKGLRYSPFNYKLYAFILINCLPSRFKPF